jgi:hypothetical protein
VYQLEERMGSWHKSPELQKIGDIMMRNAPFLKMYTEYVKNFDSAMNAINVQYAKNPKFAAILDDIHVSFSQSALRILLEVLVGYCG